MSSPPSDPDLPFSPSLLEVLHLLSSRDILNCKLVNRRLYTTILSNFHRLPRHTATVYFNTKLNEDESKVDYVYMYIHVDAREGFARRKKTGSATKVLVTQHRLRLMHSRKEHSELVKYYIGKGNPLLTTTDIPDKKITEHIEDDRSFDIIDRIYSVGNPAHYHSLDFEMTNMKETVRELTQLMASHYRLDLHIDDQTTTASVYKTPEFVLKALGEAIKESRGWVVDVKVNKMHAGLDRFCEKINSAHLSPTLKENFAGFLASISKWTCPAIITMKGFNYLPNMLDFIKSWESSSRRIPYHLRLNGSPDWSHRDLVSILKERLQNISVEHVEKYLKKISLTAKEYIDLEAVKVFVTRPADRAVLEVIYCSQFPHFCIRDSITDQ